MALILFDGVCNLCNGVVQFILQRDHRARFQFASLQSATARRILGDNPTLESVVLADGDKIYTKSDAAIRIARELPFPWPAMAFLLLIPRQLRDFLYDWIARHRYAWFGRRDACMLPKEEFRNRFVD